MKERHRRYLEILKEMGDSNRGVKGKMRVVFDADEIIKIENALKERYSKKGDSPDFGNIGVVFECPWYVVVNEPLLLKNGEGQEEMPASYLRVLYRGEIKKQKSVFCLPVIESGDFLLNISYRTNIGDFVVEAPGTVTKINEIHEDALKRCIKEKIGHEIISIKTLSKEGVISERGVMGASVPVYLVRVSDVAIEKPTDLNVVEVVKISPEELKKGFIDGFLHVSGKKCLCRDGYTSFALLLMHYLNL